MCRIAHQGGDHESCLKENCKGRDYAIEGTVEVEEVDLVAGYDGSSEANAVKAEEIRAAQSFVYETW